MTATPRGQLARSVVLDGYALNPGDVSWDALAALGPLRVHDRTSNSELLARARDAPILLTNKTPLHEDTLRALPALEYVGVLATGTNVVDLSEARRRGVVVSNVPSYGATSVAEHTLALLLEASKRLSLHLEAVRRGDWSRNPDFSYRAAPISCLAGRTLGIVGYGAIGRRVAELARAFRMRVCVARHRSRTPTIQRAADPPLDQQRSLDELFAEADFLSLHCPLTEATRHLVSAERLARMKPGATLVNTARGGLVDEAALAEALAAGRPALACLDVLSVEPPPDDHVLLRLANCHVTPHVAWASVEARRELMRVAVENVAQFLAGRPQNTVG